MKRCIIYPACALWKREAGNVSLAPAPSRATSLRMTDGRDRPPR